MVKNTDRSPTMESSRFTRGEQEESLHRTTGGKVEVLFCDNNPGKGKALRRLQEEHPGIDARVRKCLGLCGPCADQPLALVCGKPVRGKDGDDLYRLIVAALKEVDAAKGMKTERLTHT